MLVNILQNSFDKRLSGITKRIPFIAVKGILLVNVYISLLTAYSESPT